MKASFARRGLVKTTVVMALLLFAAPFAAIAQQDVLFYGVYTNISTRYLVRFFASTPAFAYLSKVQITGIAANEYISNIDFRPATGRLLAMTALCCNSTTPGRLYNLDPDTGVATQIGNNTGYAAGSTIAINPVQDRIVAVTGSNANQRINPANGSVSNNDPALAYAAGDARAGQTPYVSQIAFSNHYFGATSTVLYGIDFGITAGEYRATLVTIGTTDAPNSGKLSTVGLMSTGSTTYPHAFSIQPGTNTAYVVYVGGGGPGALYRMDLSTGNLTYVNQSTAFDAIAVAPVSPCLDIDGDGRADALTDGLMLMRAMFGLTGAALTNGALSSTAPRKTPAAIISHLNANCGTRLQ